MIVASMNLEEKLAHVRRDVDRVMRKHQEPMDRLRHALRASRDKSTRLKHLSYSSPSRIEWIVTLRCSKKVERIYLTAWWQVDGAGLEAFNLAEDTAFYFDTHFFQRYRIRESAITDALGNMRQFLETNHDLTMKRLDTERHGLKEAVGVAQEGLFLGTQRPGNIIACDTYLAYDMLRADQRTLHQELQHHAATKYWTPARLTHFRAEMKQTLEDVERLLRSFDKEDEDLAAR